MNRQFIPSSLGEGDYLPSGLFAVSVPGSGLMTEHGLIPLPAGETALRYPALGSRGQISCQPQATVRGAWVWDPANPGWTTDPRIPASPNGQIYDINDFLWINSLGSSYAGSNGYRYVQPLTNIVISGDATYAQRNLVAEWTDLSTAQDGSLLIGYAQWTTACIVWDGTHHWLIEPLGNHSRVRAHRAGDMISVAVMTDTGCALWSFTVAEISQLPIFEQTTPPPIGPVSSGRAEDGQKYNLTDFMHCDPALAQRGGPGQQTNFQLEDGPRIYYQKFGNAGTYEEYYLDTDYFYSMIDASSGQAQIWTDSRWFPVEQAIGEAHAFITGPHEAIYQNPHGCVEIKRVPFNRKMWLHALWDEFYWGPDLQTRPTMMHVYDNTAGIYSPTRIIEVRYDVYKAGWCRWEAHRSDLVYANGKAVFNEQTLVQRVDFYLLGGTTPSLIPCPCAPTVPPVPEVPVSNPTDSITYPQFTQMLAEVAAGQHRSVADYGSGGIDAYRLIAEGTPVAIAAAGNSAPTQTPHPNVSYDSIANVFVPMFVGLRRSVGKGAGYNDIAMDVFRYFGGEHWTLDAMCKDITGHDPHPLFQ